MFNSLDLFDQGQSNQSLPDNDYSNFIKSDTLNSKIEKLMIALKNELERNGGRGPNNSEDFFNWISASSHISEEDLKELSKLKTDNKNEFYKKTPKFLKYAESFSEIYIINDNIYVSEYYAKSLLKSHHPTFKDGNVQSEGGSVPLQSLPLHSGTEVVGSSSSAELEQAEEKINSVLNPEGKVFYFFISISDLLNSDSKFKEEIDIKNRNIIPMDKNEYSNIWNFFKNYYFIWFIELNALFYINDYIFFNKPLNELTPAKFMFSKYLSALEYSEEYEILDKAKIWFLHHNKIKLSSLSENTLIEYKELFIKFWIRQIISYNRLDQIYSNNYNVNMYDLSIVYEELLENILFVQCKILEANWTINTANELINSYGGIENINTDSKVIHFYNELYDRFKIEIIDKFKDVYSIRREFIIERYSFLSYEDIYEGYKYLEEINRHINFNSKLTEENFYKTNFPS